MAVSLVCPRLRDGTITAIDRSTTAIEAARKRNEEFIVAGKAVFHEAAIEDFGGETGAFDVIFAVNVNLFWLDAENGLDSVRRMLAPDGRLFLFLRTALAGPAGKDREDAS